MSKAHKGFSITEQLMYCTVRLEVATASGMKVGTGFVMQLDLNLPGYDDAHTFGVIVTNKHVVEGATRIGTNLHLQNEEALYGADWFYIDDPDKWITNHPDPNIDLATIAMFPIVADAAVSKRVPFYLSIQENELATIEELEGLAPGMSVTMIGYPNGLWDETNNKPLFRMGSTATHPGYRYNGKDEFVIDMPCFPGSSGSPVWLVAVGTYTNKHGGVQTGVSFAKLLGVLWGGPTCDADGEIVTAQIPTTIRTTTAMMMNLGYVVRANRILDFSPLLVAKFSEMVKETSDLMRRQGFE